SPRPAAAGISSIALPPLSVRNRVPAGKGLVDQNDIVSDPLNALPGDVIFLPPAEQAEEPAGAVDHDGHHLTLRYPDIHIRRIAQPAAVADVDDLLPPQVLDSPLHRAPLPFPHSMRMKGCLIT